MRSKNFSITVDDKQKMKAMSERRKWDQRVTDGMEAIDG